MEAITALVADSGNDKNAMSDAILNSVRKERVRRTGGGEFTPADIDKVGASLNSLMDGSRQIELGTGHK
jgi:hypothetical protein